MNLFNVKSVLLRDNFKQWSAIGMVAVGMALSGCGGGSSSSSASVRVANATLTHSSLDLWANAAISTATATAKNAISAYATPASGAVTLQLDDSGSTTGLTTSTPTLTGGSHYTLLAYESGAAGVATVKTALLPEDWTIPAVGVTQLRIYDAAPEAGNLDVFVTSAPVPAGTSPAGYVGSFVVSNTPTEIVLAEGTGSYYLSVTATGNPSDVRMLNMPIAVTSQQVATVALTPASGGSLLDGSLLIQQAAFSTFRNTGTRVRLASAVSGTATTVTASATNAASGTVTLDLGSIAPQFDPYVLVPAGSTLHVTVNGATVAAPTTLAPGGDMTLLVWGAPAAAVASLLSDDNRPPTNSALVKIRLINGLTGSATNALSLSANGLQVATGVQPDTASIYNSVASNIYGTTLTLSSSLQGASYFTSTPYILNANSVYTVFVVGDYLAAAPKLLVQ